VLGFDDHLLTAKMSLPAVHRVGFVSSPKRTPTNAFSTAVDIPRYEQPEQPDMTFER